MSSAAVKHAEKARLCLEISEEQERADAMLTVAQAQVHATLAVAERIADYTYLRREQPR